MTNEIISLLNKSFADEWLAYYQYWIGSKIVEGPTQKDVIAELVEHAEEELGHAQMLVDRILTLGGKPILERKLWYELTNCGYEAPTDPHVEKILKQNIKGEQCAINVYNKIINIVKGKDEITYKIANEILEDEVKHEADLTKLLNDYNLIKK